MQNPKESDMNAVETPLSPREAQIVKLLGDGHSQFAVAGAIGISESRLSQVLAENPRIREAVAQARMTRLAQASGIEAKRQSLEEKILEKLEKAVPMMGLSRPMEIAKVYQILNSAGKKAPAEAGRPEEAGMQVTVLMPTQVLGSKFKLKLSAKNEVLEVEEGVALLTASPSALAPEGKKENQDDQGRDAPGRPGQIGIDQI